MKKQIIVILSLYLMVNISLAQTNTTTGDQSGASLTTGTHNSFFGYYSGNSNTTGNQNLFLGSEAGKLSTDGNNNVFIGYRSGYSNTSGSNNFFGGRYSGNKNSTGSSNLFIGFESGRNNSTGSLNTFFGSQSGSNNTLGGTNTFIGNQSGKNNTIGSHNNFIGYQSGIKHIDGQRNIFIGNNSGNYSESGSYNVYIGDASGHRNIDGNNNIFIGYRSGYFNQIGNGNVFVGNSAGENEMGSNKLYIENSSSSSPLLYGDFTNDILKFNASVGIGIEPSYELDVDGTINATEILLNGSPISLTNQVVWQLNNNDVSYNAGNVGIGTTNPVYKFEVEKSNASNNTEYLLGAFNHSGNGGGIYLGYVGNGTDAKEGRVRSGGNTDFAIGTSIYRQALFISNASGNVGIGTTSPQSKLAVDGQIRATEVKVLANVNSVPDYVFEPEYELRTLKEIKEYIAENKHLPEIPSAKEIGKNGIDLGDMNMRLLKKIEELTLYQIELMEKLEAQSNRLLEVEKELKSIEN